MSKFLCNGAIEFPADKMDIVASVLQKHGLEEKARVGRSEFQGRMPYERGEGNLLFR